MKTIAQQLKIKDFPFKIKDKEGNQIYYENSNGFWAKSEYDSAGNEIYQENSTGYWCRWEFDSAGNRIYYEASSGVIKDNRPKYEAEFNISYWGGLKDKDDVITIEGIKYKRINE